jgi:heme/copper-type cytochrome/quinol oxidase subunit 4
MTTQQDSNPTGLFRSRTGFVLVIFLAIIAFFLVMEHTAHLFGILPYLLLLACPFLHLFMHRGHNGHSGHNRDREGHANHTDHNHNPKGGRI